MLLMPAVKIPTRVFALTSVFPTAGHRVYNNIGIWTCGWQLGTTSIVQCMTMAMCLYTLHSDVCRLNEASDCTQVPGKKTEYQTQILTSPFYIPTI